jgi:hypothetical protein
MSTRRRQACTRPCPRPKPLMPLGNRRARLTCGSRPTCRTAPCLERQEPEPRRARAARRSSREARGRRPGRLATVYAIDPRRVRAAAGGTVSGGRQWGCRLALGRVWSSRAATIGSSSATVPDAERWGSSEARNRPPVGPQNRVSAAVLPSGGRLPADLVAGALPTGTSPRDSIRRHGEPGSASRCPPGRGRHGMDLRCHQLELLEMGRRRDASSNDRVRPAVRSRRAADSVGAPGPAKRPIGTAAKG